ncbi:MAG: carboxymuconolactone decarboxylase family protein [Burkholderiales bacterium]|nr:carboxymuconolactone decarboxylase family protein [Burkholderiales bacterium]
MTRLPVTDEIVNPALADTYAQIKATRGFVSNAFRSLSHAPGGLQPLSRWGQYVKYETDLPERLRELAILCAARGVAYAWTHHSTLALQTGIPQSAVDDIGAGRVPAALPPNEQAIARFITEMFLPESVSDATFAEMTRHFSPRQITDVAMSAGYYRAFGAMATALGAEIESPDILRLEKDWQKSKAGL